MRKQGKKWATFLLCCLLLPVTPVKAETTVIEIVDYRDGQETVLQTFGTVKSAADYYAKHRDDASVANLGVRQDGKLIAVDQGIVFFAMQLTFHVGGRNDGAVNILFVELFDERICQRLIFQYDYQ